jgi:3,4-dihydroxy 2-butanone 4-phosphate synthase/GTP cyclohydrolase II
MMRGANLEEFAKKHSIKQISIAEIKEHAAKNNAINKTDFDWAKLPLGEHQWKIATFTSRNGVEHAVLALGDLTTTNLLSRIHSECLTGDAFGSLRCDCGPQLMQSISEIEERGSGLIIYLRDHEGRGIGLGEKIRAYALQDAGQNTLEANISLGHEVDERSYEDAISIFKALGISDVELLTNNPEKLAAFEGSGINLKKRKLQVGVNEFNRKYLQSKRDLMSHTLGEI